MLDLRLLPPEDDEADSSARLFDSLGRSFSLMTSSSMRTGASRGAEGEDRICDDEGEGTTLARGSYEKGSASTVTGWDWRVGEGGTRLARRDGFCGYGRMTAARLAFDSSGTEGGSSIVYCVAEVTIALRCLEAEEGVELWLRTIACACAAVIPPAAAAACCCCCWTRNKR